MSNKKHFGIDLGTNNCIVTYLEEGDNTINILKDGNKECIKSIVTLEDISNVTIGELRGESLTKSLTRTKGKLGTQRSITLNSKNYSVQYCAALMLNYLKNLHNGMESIVITIPTFYNQSMRNSTVEAAIQGGFSHIKLIEEPTAAAMYHIYSKFKNNPEEYRIKEKNMLIFDMGGGTTDLSLINIGIDEKNNVDPKVIKVKGLDNFGGYLIDLYMSKLLIEAAIDDNLDKISVKDDLDKALGKLSYYINAYKDKSNEELFKEDEITNNILYEFITKSEQAKMKLSSHENCTVEVQGYLDKLEVSRSDFEEYVLKDENILTNIENLINDFRVENPVEIDEVVMVGGTARIPLIKELLSSLFQGVVFKDDDDYINAVSKGASIVNALNSGYLVEPFGGNLCTGVIPRDIYIIFNGEERRLVEAGTPYPMKFWKKEVIRIPFSLSKSLQIEIYEKDINKKYLISKTEFFHPCFFTDDEIIMEANIDENGLLVFRASHKETKEVIEFKSERECGLNESQIENGRRHIEKNVRYRKV